MGGPKNRNRGRKERKEREEEKPMENTPQKGSGGSAKPDSTDLTGQFANAYTNLTTGLHEEALAGHLQREELCLSFMKARQDFELDAAKRATEAYQNYVKSVHEAAQQEKAQQLAQEAYQDYAATVQGLQEDTSRRTQAAYDELVTKSSEFAAESKQKVRQHYVGYVKSIQQMWTNLDPESLVA